MTTADPNAPRPRRRWLRKLAIALAASIVAFAFAELAVRIVRRARGAPHDSNAVRQQMRNVLGRMVQEFQPTQPGQTGKPGGPAEDPPNKHMLHPLQGYDFTSIDLVYTDQLTHHRETRDSTIDVFIYGGSVSAQVGNLQPKIIIDAIAADPRAQGRKVEVYSHGRGGYKQPQSMFALQNDLLYGFEPDIVVLIDGFNEVAVASQNVPYPLHPALPGGPFWLHLVGSWSLTKPVLDAANAAERERSFSSALCNFAETCGFEHSAILSSACSSLLAGSLDRFTRAQWTVMRIAGAKSAAQVVRGPSFDTSPKAVMELCKHIWFEGSVSMDAICEARGLRFVHVLQPTLHDQGSKIVTDNERKVGTAIDAWITGARDGYPLLREAGRTLKEEGIEFFDQSMLFRDVRDEIYIDACHYNEQGTQALARAVADAVLSSKELLVRPDGASGGVDGAPGER